MVKDDMREAVQAKACLSEWCEDGVMMILWPYAVLFILHLALPILSASHNSSLPKSSQAAVLTPYKQT